MKPNSRLSNEEYEALSIEYEKNPPALSGKHGFLSHIHEAKLINELLSPEYARIINMKSKAMSLSPAEVIRHAIKNQLLENA